MTTPDGQSKSDRTEVKVAGLLATAQQFEEEGRYEEAIEAYGEARTTRNLIRICWSWKSCRGRRSCDKPLQREP